MIPPIDAKLATMAEDLTAAVSGMNHNPVAVGEADVEDVGGVAAVLGAMTGNARAIGAVTVIVDDLTTTTAVAEAVALMTALTTGKMEGMEPQLLPAHPGLLVLRVTEDLLRHLLSSHPPHR